MRRSLPVSAAVFLVLLATAWWLLRPRPEPVAAPFFSLKRGTPDTLTVSFPPESTVVVWDGGGDWRVVHPVRDRADGLVLESMLRRIREIRVARVFPLTPDRMDTYGMRFPRAVLRASYADGTSPDTLVVGGFTLNGEFDYIRRGSAPEVGLLDAQLVRRYLQKETRDLRMTMLLPFHETRADSVEFRGEGGRVLLSAHRESGNWWIDRPWPGPAEAKPMDDLLSALGHTEVETFAREAVDSWAPYGLDPPRWLVRIRVHDGTLLRLAMGNPVPGADEVYARRGGEQQLLTVSNKYPPLLIRDTGELRRRAVVTFGLVDVESLRVEAGAETHVVPASAWRSSAGASPSWRGALGEWILLRADGVEPYTPESARAAGLPAPVGRLTWLGPAAAPLAVIEIGAPRGERRALRVAGGTGGRPGEILWFPENLVGPLWEILRRPPGSGDERDG